MPVLDSANPSNITLVVSALIGIAAIGSVLFNVWNAERGRAHDRTMAHDARNYEVRREFYLELVEFLQLLELWMERTEPIASPAGGWGDPPELPSDDAEGLRRLARLTVFASSDVADATTAFTKKWTAFRWQCEALRQVRAQLGPGAQEMEQWQLVEKRSERMHGS